MPLTHLRAFFCEKVGTSQPTYLSRKSLCSNDLVLWQLNIYALHRLSTWYSNTLRSLHWVDSLQSEKTSCLTELVEVQNINPIVMCAWRCKRLEEIVLIGRLCCWVLAQSACKVEDRQRIHIRVAVVAYSMDGRRSPWEGGERWAPARWRIGNLYILVWRWLPIAPLAGALHRRVVSGESVGKVVN